MVDLSDEQCNDFMWRGDPDETFSDWTIEIVSKHYSATFNSGTKTAEEDYTIVVDTYHVHRNMIAYGSRKSEYFVSLFRNMRDYPEFKTRTSRIEMDPLAAKAFPALLDYLYQYNDDKFQGDPETVTALIHMGEYLEIGMLCSDAVEFCKQDISFENATAYYELCIAFQNQAVLQVVIAFLSENVSSLSRSSHILKELSPPHWVEVVKVLEQTDCNNILVGCHAGQLVEEFCKLHL